MKIYDQSLNDILTRLTPLFAISFASNKDRMKRRMKSEIWVYYMVNIDFRRHEVKVSHQDKNSEPTREVPFNFHVIRNSVKHHLPNPVQQLPQQFPPHEFRHSIALRGLQFLLELAWFAISLPSIL